MGRWDWVGRWHGAIYQKSGGWIGAKLGPKPMLLLTTRGRRSQLPRATPLLYYLDGDTPVVVGSNGGQDHDPAWCHNLRADPDAEVRIGRERFRARAHFANAAERARLWPLLEAYNRPYRSYAGRTDREIPVVSLHRLANPSRIDTE